MKKIIALISVAAMLLTSLGGCGKNPTDSGVGGSVLTSDAGFVTESGAGNGASAAENPTQNGNKNTTKVPVTKNHSGQKGYFLNDLNNTGKKATLKNNCYSTGYPIAEKTVTLNVMIKDYNNQANYDAMKLNEFLYNKMNVKIKWTLVQANDVVNKMTLAYTSGNMPDLFVGMAPNSMSSQWNYVKQGLVLKLDDYIKNYAPNISRMFKETPAAKYSVTAQDGNIYSIPMVNSERESFAYEGLYINKTWLDTLKLSVPTTTNALLKVLNSFKNNDPNGNGKADEIPLCLVSNNMAGVLPACLYGPFGLPVYGAHAGLSIDNNGKIVVNYISDKYKTALTYYKTLYKRGLIDSEWFSNSTSDLKKKLNTGTVTVGAFVAENPLTLMSSDRFSEYTLVPAFKDKSVEKPTWSITGVEHVWGEWFLISKNCKYPEVAVRMADYFYSLEGTLTALNGPQGYNWDVKDDGSIYMSDAYYGGKHKSSDLTPGYALPNYASKAYYSLTDFTAGKNTSSWQYANAKAKKELAETYKKAAPKNVMPNLVNFNSDKKSDKEVSGMLTSYVQTLSKEFLSGDTDINTFWDNYVSVCKSLGCDNEAYYAQVAYDRYLKALG